MDSFFAKTLRPFWVDGLNEVTSLRNSLLLETFDLKNGYIFYDQIQTQSFKAKITDLDLFLCAYASDINRFGCAAVESMHEMYYKPSFLKSHSWKCVKAYYAAYYAAHALLRMHGISCTNFEYENLNSIERIADLWNMQNNISIEKGYYQCFLNASNKEILCNKITTSGNKGSHEQLWHVFLRHLEYIITEVSNLPVSPENQIFLTKFQDLKNILTSFGSNGGNWLSKVRNEINYKHIKGLWYPYKNAERSYEKIEALIQKWEEIPDTMDISTNYSRPILRFLDGCIFIVSLYLNSAKDMATLCPKGKSFHKQGVLSYLNLIHT